MADPKPVLVRGPKDCAPTLSHAGREIRAEKGVFAVPLEAVEALLRHGFKVVEGKP